MELQQDHYLLQYQIDGLNQLEITITDRLRSTPAYHRYYADVIAVNDKKTSGKLLIRMQKEDAHKLDLGFTLKTADLLIQYRHLRI